MPALMIQGTGSNVGKSLFVAGLARALCGGGCVLPLSNPRICPTMLPLLPMGAK